jgi:hypothetical protein
MRFILGQNYAPIEPVSERQALLTKAARLRQLRSPG